ncbi:Tetratricopeptide repeat-containing protein [Desulfurobacterium pacificum]|uniref:Tetratricopeptide repeat-containing protein n=1 Tax=Desulfurobacterium pacificum TaxID=240166 RepID=A0ABY1NFG6_9BACT|nr:tetratricopeptide repeat protein [Desulfurobacterium pacificum]SMP08329.1 Tetratricopeptide repeat-containing protein [Desulfurobacterium pacificum]
MRSNWWGVGIVLLIFLLFPKVVFAGTYSIQLATFPSYKYAEGFLRKLPQEIRRDAFIYKTDKGYYTVRFLTASTVRELRRKIGILKALGIKSYSFVPTDVSKIKKKRKNVIHGNGVLDVLYTVYLGNRKLDKALTVALLGIKKFPNSDLWWERLKTVATWSGKPEIALKALEKLVFGFHKWEYLRELYSMSLALNRPDLAMKTLNLMLKRGINVGFKEVINVFNVAGQPDKAAEILVRKYGNNPEALRVAANIYWYRGQTEKALEVFKILRKKYGLNPRDRLFLAHIYFAKRQFGKSLDSLKEEWQKVKDASYLRTLSNLAWALGDFDTAVKVSERLILEGKGSVDDYERVVLYFYYRKPELAAKYALDGYKRFKKDSFLIYYLFFLSSHKRWKDIVYFLNRFPENQREKLLSNADIFSIYTYALLKIGEVDRAEKLIRSAIKKSPHPSPDLISQLISLLITAEDVKGLKSVLEKYRSYEKLIPEDFLSAYLFLQDGKDALRCINFVKDRSLSFLLTKADVLELYGREGEAKKLRFKIFKKAEREVENGKRGRDIVEAYLRTAIYFEQPEKFERDYVRLKRYLDSDFAREIYLSYLLYRGRNEEVEYLQKRKSFKLKPWMRLSLALYKDDRYMMERLLSKYLEILPVRDRVAALEEIEKFGKAFVVAYKGLEENREDNRLYCQFRDLIVNYASVFSADLTFNRSGRFSYLSPHFKLRWHFEDDTYFTFESNNLLSLNGGNVLSERKGTADVAVGLKRYFHKSSLSGGVTIFRAGGRERRGFYLKGSRSFYRGSQLTVKLYVNALSDVSEIASFSTLKSGGGFEYSFPITNKYGFFSSFYLDRYYSVDGVYVGRGRELYSELSYKARSGYPDYLFRLFFSVNEYAESDHTNSYADKISEYKPADVLPDSFYQLGVGLNFGFENRNSFVRVWRPYFDSSLSYSSKYGMNASVLLGIGGKLFGDDNLHIEGTVFNGFKGTNSSGWTITSGYRLWF